MKKERHPFGNGKGDHFLSGSGRVGWPPASDAYEGITLCLKIKVRNKPGLYRNCQRRILTGNSKVTAAGIVCVTTCHFTLDLC